MNKTILFLNLSLAIGTATAADVVTERWGGGDSARHAGKVAFAGVDSGGSVATFDLSELPKSAKVLRARLAPGIAPGGSPLSEPVVVEPLTAALQGKQAPSVEDKPLDLVPPRFVTLDATDVVRRWVSGKLPNHGLLIRGPRMDTKRVFLEITYEGKLADPPPPVTGLKAFHRAGQVFLTWNEVNSKFAGKDEAAWAEYAEDTKRIRNGEGLVTTYRIYRHSAPITPANLGQAELLDEVNQYSCFDPAMSATEWKGEGVKNVKVGTARVPRLAIEPLTELKPGMGVWVRTSDKPGPRHYAVIATVNGVENTTGIDAGCATTQSLDEKVAPPEPILFRMEQLQYQRERTLFCYLWWIDPPLAHLPQCVHVSVSAGPKLGNPPPAPAATPEQAAKIGALIAALGKRDAAANQAEAELVRIGPAAIAALEQTQKKVPEAWGAPAKLPADASDADKARIEAEKARIGDAQVAVTRTIVRIRVESRDQAAIAPPVVVLGYWWGGGWGAQPCPQDEGLTLNFDSQPWRVMGIHEGNGTLKAWSQGKVQNFQIRQLQGLLPWMQSRYRADLERIYACSGAWAWHYPEVFAATFEALSMNSKRSPAMPEVRGLWNDPKTPPATEWGMSPYEYWNAGEWIRNHPEVELAFMSYTPYQHLGDFGKIDKPAFFAAMRDTRHGFAATFNDTRSLFGLMNPDWVLQLRRTDSFPAFTNCSLDDNPGIGLGWDPGGQINGYLSAEPRTQVDKPDRWEMTVYLFGGNPPGRNAAPRDACTADVTPRRCQQFKPKPGDKFTWTNQSVPDGKAVQSGTAVADKYGLVTAESVVVPKGKNRLIFAKSDLR